MQILKLWKKSHR